MNDGLRAMAVRTLTADIHHAVVEFIDAGRPFALATVLRNIGSTPRQAGTKAIVDVSGDIWGTIGGGRLEADVQRLALEAMAGGHARVVDFKFHSPSAEVDEPVCGGAMRLLIDPAVSLHREAFLQASQALRQRRRGLLLTAVQSAMPPRVSIRWMWPDERGPSEPAHAAIDVAWKHLSPRYFADAAGEGLAEPLLPTPLLLVCGGGHVGQAIARHVILVGFDVIVIDDRPEFADPARHPGAQTRCGNPAELLANFPATEDVYVAIVGRGHLVDAAALAACIARPFAYVGMMGSRRKVELLRKHFLETGRATEQQWSRLHAPIGIDIGAQTVPEIAASVVAELVAVRRGTHPSAAAP